MYTFNKNIYFANGVKYSCIYDLNKGLLYRLPYYELSLVISFLNGEEKSSNFKIIHDCINKGLIVKSEHKQNGVFPNYNPKSSDINMAWIEITNKCNMQCRHCFNSKNINQNLSMSLHDFNFVIDELTELNINNLQLIGGEPLLINTDTIENMISYTIGKFESVEIFTNATLLTNRIASYLSKTGVKVAVSVYSYNSFNHDLVTKISGSHVWTLQGIELLKKYNIPYRIASTLMAGIDLGDKNTDLFSLNSNRDVIRMTGRGNIKLLSVDLIKKRLITEKNFSKPLSYSYIKRLTKGHNCFLKDIYIAADLTVYPCVMERRISHGNLRGNRLYNIIKPDIQNFNKNQVDVCKDCEFRFACFDCRPDSLSKNITAKPWYCTYDPYKGQFIDEDIFIKGLFDENE